MYTDTQIDHLVGTLCVWIDGSVYADTGIDHLVQNQNQNQNPLLTSLYTHNKYMAYVNSSEMLPIYLALVVHE